MKVIPTIGAALVVLACSGPSAPPAGEVWFGRDADDESRVIGRMTQGEAGGWVVYVAHLPEPLEGFEVRLYQDGMLASISTPPGRAEWFIGEAPMLPGILRVEVLAGERVVATGQLRVLA